MVRFNNVSTSLENRLHFRVNTYSVQSLWARVKLRLLAYQRNREGCIQETLKIETFAFVLELTNHSKTRLRVIDNVLFLKTKISSQK